LKPGKPFDPMLKPCSVSGPIAVDGPSPAPMRNSSLRHSAPVAKLNRSNDLLMSKLTMCSVCSFEPGWKRNPAGWFGPSDAFTVLYMKKSISLLPYVVLTSQFQPEPHVPLTPPVTPMSCRSPPKRGVKPPVNTSRNVKQLAGSAPTCAETVEYGMRLPEASRSAIDGHEPTPVVLPTSSVSPPSLEYT